MDPVLLCDDLEVRVVRDGEVRVPVTVHNPGPAEDHYRVELLGDAARWGRIEPRFLPGVAAGRGTGIEAVLRPPRDAPPGATPFAVRCVSLADPSRCAVVEGDVVVGASRDVDVAAAAVAASGRRSGRYLVQVANRGRGPAPVRLSATDPRAELTFAVAPREFTLEPGESRTAYVSARPRHPKLVGTPVTHSFVVEHHGPTGSADRLPQRFEQRALLGPLTGTLAGLLLAAVLAFGGLLAWSGLRGPAAPAAAKTSAPGAGALHGSYVIWAATPIGDVGNREAPARLVAELQAAGVPARIVDTRTTPQLATGPVPALLVVQDGFPDLAAAQAACAAHRDLAPACSAAQG